MTLIRWRKSSRSGGSTQTSCVELAGNLAAVRDSKNPDGPMLHVDVAAMVRAVRTGRLGDR
jgi:hypothetical protein